MLVLTSLLLPGSRLLGGISLAATIGISISLWPAAASPGFLLEFFRVLVSATTPPSSCATVQDTSSPVSASTLGVLDAAAVLPVELIERDLFGLRRARIQRDATVTRDRRRKPFQLARGVPDIDAGSSAGRASRRPSRLRIVDPNSLRLDVQMAPKYYPHTSVWLRPQGYHPINLIGHQTSRHSDHETMPVSIRAVEQLLPITVIVHRSWPGGPSLIIDRERATLRGWTFKH